MVGSQRGTDWPELAARPPVPVLSRSGDRIIGTYKVCNRIAGLHLAD